MTGCLSSAYIKIKDIHKYMKMKKRLKENMLNKLTAENKQERV